MAGTLSPYVKLQFFTDAGAVAASHRLFVYLAGTSTKTTTYTDAALATPNSNPITLDSAGRCVIYLVPGTNVKYVLAPSGSDDPPTSPVWTQDDIEPTPAGSASADTDVSGTAGETLAAGEAVYLSDGSGGATTGRWYKTDSDNTYSSTAASIIGFATEAISTGSSGAIRVKGRVTGLSGLTAGTVYYISATAGALTSSAPTNARAILQADATTAGVVLSGEPYAGASTQGVVSTGTQTIAGAKTFSSAATFSALATFSAGAGFPISSILNFAYARVSANVTVNNSTTLTNVTGLSFSEAANEVWAFLFLLHGVSSAVADWKFAVTCPAASTALRLTAVSGTDQPLPAASSVATCGSALTLGGAGADEGILVYGLHRNGANSGTIQLQFAQNTAEASNTVIYAESAMLAFRVG